MEKDDGISCAAGGSGLDFSGKVKSRLSFGAFSLQKFVRIMATLPDIALLGRDFWRKQGLVMNIVTNIGTINSNSKRISGPLSRKVAQVSTERVREIVQDDEVDTRWIALSWSETT